VTTPTADPAEARRLADCEWYRNLAGRWDNEISFYYCDHIVFLMLGGNGLHIARAAARVFGWSSDETQNLDWCPNHEE